MGKGQTGWAAGQGNRVLISAAAAVRPAHRAAAVSCKTPWGVPGTNKERIGGGDGARQHRLPESAAFRRIPASGPEYPAIVPAGTTGGLRPSSVTRYWRGGTRLCKERMSAKSRQPPPFGKPRTGFGKPRQAGHRIEGAIALGCGDVSGVIPYRQRRGYTAV